MPVCFVSAVISPSRGTRYRSSAKSRSQPSWRWAAVTIADESASQAMPSCWYGPGVRFRGRPRPVGPHDVDVARPVGDPPDVVEPAEERLDLAGWLPALVLGLVAGVAGAAGERDPRPVGRPLDVVDAIRHRDDGAGLARAVDGQDVERGVVLLGRPLLATARREGQEPAVGRPHRGAVARPGGQRRRRAVGPGQPDAAAGGVLVDVDRRDDERGALTVGRQGRTAGRDPAVDDAAGDVAVGGRRRGGRALGGTHPADGSVSSRSPGAAMTACPGASGRGPRPCGPCSRGPPDGAG